MNFFNIQDAKINHPLNSEFKEKNDHKRNSILIKSIPPVQKIIKNVNWNNQNDIRIVNKDTIIEGKIESKKGYAYTFLMRNNATISKLRRLKKRKKFRSLKPENVKEIKAVNKQSLINMKDSHIIKHYKRLVEKQEVVFKVKRGRNFQKIVNDYIEEFQREIIIRKL